MIAKNLKKFFLYNATAREFVHKIEDMPNLDAMHDFICPWADRAGKWLLISDL